MHTVSSIQPWHLEKLALVYVRQSSIQPATSTSTSMELQRSLADQARQWGWPASRVQIIADDFGVCGSHSSPREGFRQIRHLIERGEVALVLVSDLSRLGRDLADVDNLLRIATHHETMIAVNDQLSSPGDTEIFTPRLHNRPAGDHFNTEPPGKGSAS